MGPSVASRIPAPRVRIPLRNPSESLKLALTVGKPAKPEVAAADTFGLDARAIRPAYKS